MLLPGAERERRALLLGAALVCGALCSWWPAAPVEAAADRAVGPLAAPLANAAAWLAAQVVGAPAPPPAATAPEPGWLERGERAAALPRPLPGFAWIEVPVQGIAGQGTLLGLAAGARAGLADGMFAACGRQYLGRLTAVGPDEAMMKHFRAVDERTGVLVAGADGAAARGIAIGRGRQPPLLLLEGGVGPEPGDEVFFRGRPGEPPAYAEAHLRLGACARAGDPTRGEQVWVVAGELPALAEGRVFVAAGALPAEPLSPPALYAVEARASLRADAVLGARLRAFDSSPLPLPAAVAELGGRVFGPVLRQRGALSWARADAVEDWIRREAAWLPEVETPPGWFTRGRGRVPRGLWLGAAGDAPPSAGAARLLASPFPRDL